MVTKEEQLKKLLEGIDLKKTDRRTDYRQKRVLPYGYWQILFY